jgi:hypothetical protein
LTRLTSQGLSDVKVVAKEEGKKEKKETLVASSSADALPPVDLRSSILFFSID